MIRSSLSLTNKGLKMYQKLLIHLLILGFWLLIWESLYRYVGRAILVVSPVDTLIRILELGQTAIFWTTIYGTTLRVLEGVCWAFLFGATLAILTHRYDILKQLFEPMLGIIRTIPVASIIILALIWLPVLRTPVFTVFLTVTPMIWSNIYEGLGVVDINLLEMAQVFKWKTIKKWRYIYLPTIAPYVASSLSTGIGAAWRTAIGTEVIARPAGSIGRMIYDSRIHLRTLDLFAWTVVVLILSISIVTAVTKILHHISHKLTEDRS